jgi:hypothetical protein
MDDREANWYSHPPACTCVNCVKRRLARYNGSIDNHARRVTRMVHKENAYSFRKPSHLTYRILIGIAILFALLAGLSVMAWLLPSMFNSFGNALIRITGNDDIRLNVRRIGSDPIPYALGFTLIALFIRWLASKF